MSAPTPEPRPSSDAPDVGEQRFPETRTVEGFQPNVMKHLRSIYAAHAESECTWTASQTIDFIRNLQKHEQVFGDDGDAAPLDLAGFLDYMASSNAAAILPRNDQDLSWPISAYFISSSHNTYLTGNQLYSDSTTEAYANVLRRGCRCVEIDPRVLHGYTLTKEVPFRDVCATIRKHAFEASDLPLIISLEVHCNAEQQAVMVDIMKEAWGDVAVVAPPEKQGPAVLPSPDALRGKILVKVKYAPAGRSYGEGGDGEEEGLGRIDSGLPVKTAEKKKPSKIIRALSDLGIYTRAVSFKSWAQPEATMQGHIFSMSEKMFTTHHTDNSAKLFEHNRDYMMRAYPSGLRIGSSNLNPPPFWGSGAQIVALNWQQTDEGMMLNQGMFEGTNGYVLKPQGYRPNLASKSCPNTIIRKTLSLSVAVFAAQYIPLPSGDSSDSGFHPYVKMELHVDGNPSHDLATGKPRALANQGHERDGEHKVHTKSHRGGADVDFHGQVLSFRGITDIVEELTFLRFKVCDDEIVKDDLAAWACVRLDQLASGYRFIHLWDTKSQYTKGVILVKIEKQLS
ncbi:PLC-like phosphodiesterase, TIM beta/alpha-barrel domain [Cordyceps militaris CM01]|uniref:Phosphoinositide phospholipase C n=1 Tax=Cordyceps militaris (strain CM01) TaxID=983644 RepID=G3JGE5_CORMM|nr:PLC-like phosphodiesterase, TIM beta/alpha-barrel domain [Cordyceps militaris CM01]EGX93658.1 PLC-like phosphodiesterase, TIM beta/alpha-barrel domain [Cordyceps militaris CM01]